MEENQNADPLPLDSSPSPRHGQSHPRNNAEQEMRGRLPEAAWFWAKVGKILEATGSLGSHRRGPPSP
ncbi:hypothetical protein E2562_025739 [Oryza meyeriana var. granulata]|uniref:Uncharacterized protein n=1 Tax=Oryza meyeriana var. granulata TaxID=110450 RepID=A0A6G1CTE5_9ORYZ|nr:hypothetical protein E2562_025739 [Oryza meyeriana var. granulata]